MKRYVTYLLGLFGILWVTGSCVDPMTGPDPAFGRDGIVLHFGLQPAFSVDVSTKSTQGLDAESRVDNLYLFFFSPQGALLYKEFYGSSTLNRRWAINKNKTDEAPWDGTVYINDDSVASIDGITVVGFCNTDEDLKTSLDGISTMAGVQDLSLAIGETSLDYVGSMLMTGVQESVSETGGHFYVNGTEMMLPLRRLHAKVRFRVAINPANVESFNLVNWQVFRLPKSTYLLERGSYEDRSANRSALVDKGGSDAGNYFDMEDTSHQYDLRNDQYNPSDNTQLLSREFSFYMLENRKSPAGSPAEAWTYGHRDRKRKTASGMNEDQFLYADNNATYVVIKAQVWMRKQDVADPTVSANVEYLVHLGDFSEDNGSFDTFRNHSYIYTLTINDVGDIRHEVEHNTFDPNNPYGNENEAGAKGKVVVAREEIYDTDAHYSSHVINFHVDNIDEERITWYVETPFNPKGDYPNLDAAGNTEIYSGDNAAYQGKPRPKGGDDNSWGMLDYEWVEFRVNAKNENGTYSQRRRIYKPKNYNWNQTLDPNDAAYESPADMACRTMDVIGLVNYLKQQKLKYKAGEENDFDSEKKIAVTTFVNEYYYEKHPFTGTYDRDLWKSVVNVQSPPMRYMHILSQIDYSADKESVELGSSFTIQQHPIQSIYNIANPDLRSAWGSEWYDDESTQFPDKGKYSPESGGKRGNNKQANGRYNSLLEWKTRTNSPRDKNHALYGSFVNGTGTVRWDEYMDLTAENTTPLLWHGESGHGDYRYLRWGCMTRNRDNNGNGLIDLDEVRWYMGATHQLLGLFLGSRGVVGAAQLYQRTSAQQLSSVTTEWRQHVISSSLYDPPKNKPTDSDAQPRVLWAEEGMSGSNPANSSTYADGMKEFSTRCVRNLGAYQTSASADTWNDITYAPETVEPQPYIDVIRLKDNDASHTTYSDSYTNDVYYVFDCSRMNEASLRAFWDSGDVNGTTNRDLILHNENEGAAFLSRRFAVASQRRTEQTKYKTVQPDREWKIEKDGGFVTYNCQWIEGMNNYITDSGSNPFCPPGYRLPNVRELGVLWNFIPDAGFQRNCYFSRTYWSFGSEAQKEEHRDAARVNGQWLGENKPNGTTKVRWGWGASQSKVLMADAGTSKTDQKTDWVRCVRDLHPGEF